MPQGGIDFVVLCCEVLTGNTDCAKRIESRNFSYLVPQIVKHAKFGLVYLANTG